MDPTPLQPSPDPGAMMASGMTRATLTRDGHVFEFRCEAGHEASLARAVMEMSRAGTTPMRPGDAFALCRQILSIGGGGAAQDIAAKPEDGESQERRKAA